MSKNNQQRLLLGAHTSIASGLEQALLRAESIGCSTVQIFTKNNRQWNAKNITPQEAELFKNTHKNSTIGPVIAHATYLINIGSADPAILARSQGALKIELERCEQLAIKELVLHPGAHITSGEDACLKQISESINTILATTPGTTKILLEIMAGQGSTVCYSLEHLASVIKNVENKKRIGVCVDTCHAFAAGYDLRTPATYEHFWEQFDSYIGLNYLHAIHLNDSKGKLESRIDRHESIGKGELGLKPFELLFNDKRFFDIPKILETPEGTLEDYAKDMAVIKSLLSQETKKILGVI